MKLTEMDKALLWPIDTTPYLLKVRRRDFDELMKYDGADCRLVVDALLSHALDQNAPFHSEALDWVKDQKDHRLIAAVALDQAQYDAVLQEMVLTLFRRNRIVIPEAVQRALYNNTRLSWEYLGKFYETVGWEPFPPAMKSRIFAACRRVRQISKPEVAALRLDTLLAIPGIARRSALLDQLIRDLLLHRTDLEPFRPILEKWISILAPSITTVLSEDAATIAKSVPSALIGQYSGSLVLLAEIVEPLLGSALAPEIRDPVVNRLLKATADSPWVFAIGMTLVELAPNPVDAKWFLKTWVRAMTVVTDWGKVLYWKQLKPCQSLGRDPLVIPLRYGLDVLIAAAQEYGDAAKYSSSVQQLSVLLRNTHEAVAKADPERYQDELGHFVVMGFASTDLVLVYVEQLGPTVAKEDLQTWLYKMGDCDIPRGGMSAGIESLIMENGLAAGRMLLGRTSLSMTSDCDSIALWLDKGYVIKKEDVDTPQKIQDLLPWPESKYHSNRADSKFVQENIEMPVKRFWDRPNVLKTFLSSGYETERILASFLSSIGWAVYLLDDKRREKEVRASLKPLHACMFELPHVRKAFYRLFNYDDSYRIKAGLALAFLAFDNNHEYWADDVDGPRTSHMVAKAFAAMCLGNVSSQPYWPTHDLVEVFAKRPDWVGYFLTDEEQLTILFSCMGKYEGRKFLAWKDFARLFQTEKSQGRLQSWLLRNWHKIPRSGLLDWVEGAALQANPKFQSLIERVFLDLADEELVSHALNLLGS